LAKIGKSCLPWDHNVELANIFQAHKRVFHFVLNSNNFFMTLLNKTTKNDFSKNKKREIIYIRYDDTNMKYVYLCSDCATIWQTNNNSISKL
jgi:hypothetical protein